VKNVKEDYTWPGIIKAKLERFAKEQTIGYVSSDIRNRDDYCHYCFFIPESLVLAPMLTENGTQLPTHKWILAAAIFFFYYIIGYTVTIFSNTALVGATMKLVKGEPATVGDGLAIALSRLGKIIVYALISATVGVIARGISRSGRDSDNAIVSILAAIIGSLVQGAWNLVVFFAIPVIVAEDISVGKSLKRSFALFRQTWGEGFVGSTAVSGISCLVMVVIFLVTGGIAAAGIMLNTWPLLILGIVLLVVGIMLVALLNGAVNGIFQASLYHFATTGDAGPFIDTEMARDVFRS
jgi:hypothetical protein